MIFKIINDANVSLEAKGLYMYLTTLSSDYPIGDNEIARCSTDSKETIANATKELIKTGYIVKNVAISYDKTVKVNIYTINYEEI